MLSGVGVIAIRTGGAGVGKQQPKTVLFLGSRNRTRGPAAVRTFNAAAARMGLPWAATSRGLAADATDPATTADLAAAARVVLLDRGEHEPILRSRFPEWTGPVEGWDIPSGPGAAAAVEAAVNALIARLLGGTDRPAVPPPAPPKPTAPKPPAKPVKVGRETAGRRGKGVTVVWDLPLTEAGLTDLAAQLKTKCGTGGTVKDGRIEIQGDHRDRLVAELEALGYAVKRSGG
jgi:predicted translation initiation factor SUI1